MQGVFVSLYKDKILQYNKEEEIPQSFDKVIKFEPTPPEPPHT